MTSPDYPWHDLHHKSYYLPPVTTTIQSSSQYIIEAIDFIPLGHIYWFWHPIPTLDAFEEGNIANISPTLKIGISYTLEVMENINMGASCSPSKVVELTLLV